MVVIVDVTKPDALDRLEGYASQGAVGVRLAPDQRSAGDDPLAIWRKADELGLVISSMGGIANTSSNEFNALVAQFPNMPFVLEHIAGGSDGAGFPANGPGPQPPYARYKKALELAEYPNTYMKLPGLGELSRRPQVLKTRCGFDFYDSIPPLVELAHDAFIPNRLMWGSDWPVCLTAGSYRTNFDVTMGAVGDMTDSQRALLLGDNAKRFYRVA